jgi:hypothetical protein
MDILVDTDVLLHKAAFSAEATMKKLNTPEGKPMSLFLDDYDWDVRDEIFSKYECFEDPTVMETFDYAMSFFNLSILRLYKHTNEPKTKYIFTTTISKREELLKTQLYPEYKNNRKNKPVFYYALRQWFLDKVFYGGLSIKANYRNILMPKYEADDVIATVALELKNRNEQVCIASIDKDLDQIPGLHYNLTTQEFYEVSLEDACYKHYYLAMHGDRGDNVPGIYAHCKDLHGEEVAVKMKNPSYITRWKKNYNYGNQHFTQADDSGLELYYLYNIPVKKYYLTKTLITLSNTGDGDIIYPWSFKYESNG